MTWNPFKKNGTGDEAQKPLPEAEIIYGSTPTEAYKEWMKYFAPAKEATNVGSA